MKDMLPYNRHHVAELPSLVARPQELTRAQWISACADRLIELRPTGDARMLQAIAREMFEVVGYFDPVLAAEIEHEGGMLDD